MPIYSSSESDDFPASPKRLFGSEKPLHALLGGGKAADILLWRNKNLSAAILIGSTIIWLLFEVLEYNFVTLLCHASMILMLALLIWSIGADMVDLNRLDPRTITIPESTFRWLFAKANRILLRFYDVSSGKDLKTFILAIAFLSILSGIGDYFSSLNLLYTSCICLMTIPALYERYQGQVDYLASRGNRDMKKLYKKIDSRILNKIPRGPVKEKKRF
ncbi:reticulon-like protein B9 [Sesamum indicum]|uniref:Reticulon-like protein n=1 Tax=Sesamum indicum TaxID=4182 RepID=A0A8M8UUZ5_SESIN|nr:reticulon-like protein B9 [Sesamum indicum]